jgi:NAD(P)-dependent dehydrogenase (short-subunit alcohol dehydrogenase family)
VSLVAILSRMAKHAAEAFSDILRLEMVRFGVRVVIVEPGNFGAATDGLNVSYCACHPNIVCFITTNTHIIVLKSV